MTGRIVTVFEQRSFSFIQDDQTGEEIFAHVMDYPDRQLLPVGTQVEFELGTFRNRSKAINIRQADPESVGGLQ